MCCWEKKKEKNCFENLGTSCNWANHLDMMVAVVAVAHCSSGKVLEVAMAVGSLAGRCFHIVVVGWSSYELVVDHKVVMVVAVIGAVTHKMFGVDKYLFAAVVKSKLCCNNLGCGFVVAVVCFCLWFLLESYLN